MVSLGHFDFDFDFPLGKGLWEGKPYHAGCLNDTSPSRPQTAVPEGCSLLLQSQPKSSGWGAGPNNPTASTGQGCRQGSNRSFRRLSGNVLTCSPLTCSLSIVPVKAGQPFFRAPGPSGGSVMQRQRYGLQKWFGQHSNSHQLDKFVF